MNTTHPFTCNTCQVAFKTSDLQRTHMQSDWHRYNLKRRVASLPPLSSEVFNEKVLANRASQAATAEKASYQKPCEVCKKTFYSENAYVNHLSSGRHRDNLRRAGKRDDDSRSVMSSTFSLGESARTEATETMDSDAEEEFQEVIDGMNVASLKDKSEPVSRRPTRPHHSAGADGEERPDHPLSPDDTASVATNNSRIRKRDPLKECLFCSHHDSETLDQALDHMFKVHGLFIPEPNYIDDMEGLIKYLNTKVNEEHQCLYCGRLKWSEDGIKTHMRDTNHCKIAYESEDAQLELGQFYDFRSTYSDEEEEWSTDDEDDEEMSDEGAAPGGGVKLGAKRTAKTDGDEEGEGWETDSTASSVPTEELGRVYVDEKRDEVRARLDKSKHHSSSNSSSQRHRSTDGFHSHAHHSTNSVYYDDVELHLPSGRTAGHRSLNKIWRQNLRSHPSPAEREQKLLTEGDSSDTDKADMKPSEAARERERGRGRELAVRNNAMGVMGLDDAEKRKLGLKTQKEAKRAERQQRRFQQKVAEKANHQKHFRDPLLQ